MRVYFKFLGTVLLVSLLTCSPVMADPESTASDGRSDALETLIGELQKVIEDADRRMVAHPSFIEELRALVDRYQAKIRHVFFSDTFSDGNYTHAPAWQVRAGDFAITPDNRLRCQVFEKAAPSKATNRVGSENPEDAFKTILRDILGAPSERKTPEETPSKPSIKVYGEKAVIETKVAFASAFEVDVSLMAEPSTGGMEIVLIGGEPAQPLYRMVYQATPSKDRPIQIIRERGGRSYVIEAATEYPFLEDGGMHRIQWIRDVYGNMSVVVDGTTVLRTVELYYRDSFSGLALANQGGTYEWDSIRILQPQKEQTE